MEFGRHYVEFYRQYSRYWRPPATKHMMPYRGLWVPVDHLKEEVFSTAFTSDAAVHCSSSDRGEASWMPHP